LDRSPAARIVAAWPNSATPSGEAAARVRLAGPSRDRPGASVGDAVDPAKQFPGPGFESLTAVEAANRLPHERTGCGFARTLFVFDHPTPAAPQGSSCEPARFGVVPTADTVRTEIDRLGGDARERRARFRRHTRRHRRPVEAVSRPLAAGADVGIRRGRGARRRDRRGDSAARPTNPRIHSAKQFGSLKCRRVRKAGKERKHMSDEQITPLSTADRRTARDPGAAQGTRGNRLPEAEAIDDVSTAGRLPGGAGGYRQTSCGGSSRRAASRPAIPRRPGWDVEDL